MATCFLNNGWAVNTLLIQDNMISECASMIHYLKVKIILGIWHLLNHEYGAVV
ncbi:MAG: hypothetical protein WAL21_05870 [Nitrososphaeraceae archaeon]